MASGWPPWVTLTLSPCGNSPCEGLQRLLSCAMAELSEDHSADTARFQAFVQHREDEPPTAWEMRAPAKKIGLLAAIVVAVAIIAALIALTLLV
jgi:hypothetical protein